MLKFINTLLKISVFTIFTLLISITTNAATLTVNNTADAGAGTLRQALVDANINAEANVIIFDIPTTDPGFDPSQNRFTISILSPLPNVPLANMTITNPQVRGVTVMGNGTFRIFTLVNSAVVTISNLTISNGFSGDGLGGGIYMGNSSTLSLDNCTVEDNIVTGQGGGIYLSNSSTLH